MDDFSLDSDIAGSPRHACRVEGDARFRLLQNSASQHLSHEEPVRALQRVPEPESTAGRGQQEEPTSVHKQDSLTRPRGDHIEAEQPSKTGALEAESSVIDLDCFPDNPASPEKPILKGGNAVFAILRSARAQKGSSAASSAANSVVEEVHGVSKKSGAGRQKLPSRAKSGRSTGKHTPETEPNASGSDSDDVKVLELSDCQERTLPSRKRPHRAGVGNKHKGPSPSASTQSVGGSDFQLSDQSEEPTPEKRRKRGRKRRKGDESDSSVSFVGEGSMGSKSRGSDFFLTAAEKKRRKAAAELEAAKDMAKSAAVRRQEAVEQLKMEKQQRMEERAAFMGTKKANPFFAPRAATPVPASEQSIKENRQPKPLAELLPPLNAMHVNQGAKSSGQPCEWGSWQLLPKTCTTTLADIQKHTTAAATQFSGLSMHSLPVSAPGRRHSEPGECQAVEPAVVTDPSLNALWTDRYQPRTASQVCGDRHCLTQLAAWLKAWRPGAGSADVDGTVAEAAGDLDGGSDSDEDFLMRGVGRRFYGDLSSDEEETERCQRERQPCNAVWLSGPTGCGKTSALAAVARDLGLRTIEVNPGSDRAGANVLRSIGEATRSNRLPACAEAFVVDDTGPAVGDRDGQSSSSRTLIIFEEVDSLMEEDRGFLSALAGLVLDSKRPIIMTSESRQPPPGLHNLNLKHLELRAPTAAERVQRVRQILAAERGEVPVSHSLAADLAEHSPCDLRHAVLQAQLWHSSSHTGQLGPELSLADVFWEGLHSASKEGSAADCSMLSAAADHISDFDHLFAKGRARGQPGSAMDDELEWQVVQQAGDPPWLAEDFPACSLHLLGARRPVELASAERRSNSRDPARQGRASSLVRDAVSGAAPQLLTSSRLGRVSAAWALARMAAVEADRKEAEEICPTSLKRGGRRRRCRWYLEDEVKLSAATLQAGLALSELAVYNCQRLQRLADD